MTKKSIAMRWNLVCWLSLSSGCADSIDGLWMGYLDCGPGTVDIAMELDLRSVASDFYDLSGGVYWYDAENAWWQIDYAGDLRMRGTGSYRTLDVRLTSCVEIDLGVMDCPRSISASWDRSDDLLEGVIFDFLGDEQCDFVLY
jgi:hypothetical protein